MKFSLKFAFIVLTFAALLAFSYRLQVTQEQLVDENVELEKKLSAFPDRLEVEYPYFKLAEHADTGYEAIAVAVKKRFASRVQQHRLKQPFTPDRVSVRNIPDLNYERRKFLIHVPAGYSAKVSLESEVALKKPYGTISGLIYPPIEKPSAKKVAVFSLPAGVSSVDVKNIEASAVGAAVAVETPSILQVKLNNQVVHQIEQFRQQYNMLSGPEAIFIDAQQDGPPEVGALSFCRISSVQIAPRKSKEDAQKNERHLIFKVEYQSN